MNIKINYELSYGKYNFRNDLKGAISAYLSDNDDLNIKEDNDSSKSIVGIIIYQESINDFLKIMALIDEIKNIIIVPAFNNDSSEKDELNKPAYLIIKYPGNLSGVSITL